MGITKERFGDEREKELYVYIFFFFHGSVDMSHGSNSILLLRQCDVNTSMKDLPVASASSRAAMVLSDSDSSNSEHINF